MAKEKIVVAAGATGITPSDVGFLQAGMLGVTGIFSSFSSPPADGTGTYYHESTLGKAGIGAMLAGVVVGDMWGDKLPLIGGHRS